ncbi:MAG: class I SAM-dependent methyltransferase [Proteobacteria bacterium]|nr:class I SAM-dependent methyltransferase [Pseudomonadota bacterium]
MHETPQTLFDELADGYEEMRKELGWDPFVHIKAAFAPETLANKRVLDAGCGTGECTRWLQAQGAEPYGLDISPEMCFAAAENSENIPYLTHDLSEALPFDDKRFDIVIALGCLEYLENIETTVAEFARVLDAHGVFLGCFERYGDDCPGGHDKTVTFFDDWARFRQSDDEIKSLISRYFSSFELAHVPGFKLTDDDGNETGETTQYIRVIARKS